MSTRSKATALIAREHSGPEGGEQRLKELAIKLADKVTRVVRLDPRFSEEILRSVRQKLG